MKNTKGPWIIEMLKLDPKLMGLEFPIQQKIARIKTEDGFRITEVFDTAFPDLNESNARLIAVAPEMLEALEKVLNSMLNPTENTRLAVSELVKIKELISKAKGEA